MDDTDCLFCRIASGTLPAHTVYEDEAVVAFLDRGPIRPGHMQIIPRAHFAYFDDLPEDLMARISRTAQLLARAIKLEYGVERVGFAFTGGDVKHAHAHLIPLVAPDDLTSRRYIVETDVTYAELPVPPDAAQRQLTNRLAAHLVALRRSSAPTE